MSVTVNGGAHRSECEYRDIEGVSVTVCGGTRGECGAGQAGRGSLIPQRGAERRDPRVQVCNGPPHLLLLRQAGEPCGGWDGISGRLARSLPAGPASRGGGWGCGEQPGPLEEAQASEWDSGAPRGPRESWERAAAAPPGWRRVQ